MQQNQFFDFVEPKSITSDKITLYGIEITDGRSKAYKQAASS